MYIRSGSKNVKILAGDGDDHIDGDFRYLDAGSGDDFVEVYNYGYKVDYFDGGTGTDELLIIPVGCLLYTSPSPRDSCASRMPSSA